MGCTHNFTIFFLILVISATSLFNAQGRKVGQTPPDYSKEEKTRWRVQIGSRPPRCERRCYSCDHCEAIQVPANPRARNSSPSAVMDGRDYGSSSNYKPMSWKCKCGNLFFNP